MRSDRLAIGAHASRAGSPVFFISGTRIVRARFLFVTQIFCLFA